MKTLIINDLRNIFRDKTLTLIFFVPLSFILLLRFGIPAIVSYFPVIADYYPLIISFTCILISVFPSYILSFIMLDEKDMNVQHVFRVLPFSYRSFIIYRIGFIYVLAFVFSCLAVALSGLVKISPITVVVLSAEVAMVSPFSTFLILNLAKNKIEGITFFKLVNFMLFLPSIYFFAQTTWKNLLAIFPVFWTFLIYNAAIQNQPWLQFWIAGMLHQGVLIWFLINRYSKKPDLI